MWQTLHDTWWRLATQSHPRSFWDTLACGALRICSAVYGGLVLLRNTAYSRGWVHPARLSARVVSVGNVTVGGTGKTACVELIARKLTAMGRRVAVLSRGYGGRGGDYWLQWSADGLLVNGEPNVGSDSLADEPQLLARRLEGVPVFVGARRARTGRQACTTVNPEVLLLDDGFQHRQLHRDGDIVLLSARMPTAGWTAFPRGPMREPMAALRRAHIVILTKVDEVPSAEAEFREVVRRINPEATFVSAVHEPTEVVDALTEERYACSCLHGPRVGLVSSIGDPEGFAATVRRLNARIQWHAAFPDHYRFRATDWSALCARAQASQLRALVTTEKDWMRLRPLLRATSLPSTISLWVVRVQLRLVNGASEFDDRLARLLAR